MSEYALGQKLRFTATFKTYPPDLTLTDPTTVTFTVLDPSGNQSSPATVVNVSTGVYRVEYEPDEEGSWWYRWVGTGTLVAAGEGEFSITTAFS